MLHSATTSDAPSVPPDRPLTWSWFLFSLKGRVTRGELWRWWMPWYLAAMFVLGRMAEADPPPAVAVGIILVYLASLWPSIAIPVKRLHDRGRSGCWLLTPWVAGLPIAALAIVGPKRPPTGLLVGAVIPGVVAILWLMVQISFLRGMPGPNHFGDDPLPVHTRVR